MPRMNGSREIRQPTDAAGKFPHWFPGPKREEPSRRMLTDAR